MMAKLTLNKKQEEMLYLLRLDGLRREIELQEATEAYEKAQEIDKTVHQYVIDTGEYYDELTGEKITEGRDDYMMNDEVFKTDYLPKVKTAYMELYGIDNPLNFVYSSPMRDRKHKAEQDYLMIAVDFLKISNRPEAAAIEKAVKGYLKPEFKVRLMKLNEEFINEKAARAV